MSDHNLNPGADRTEFAPGWALSAPGFAGRVEFVLVETGRRMAGVPESLGALDEAIAAAGMSERAVAALDIHDDSPAREARRRGESAQEVVVLEAPPPEPGYEQVVLVAAEDGRVSWHLHEPAIGDGTRRGLPTRRYTITLSPAAPAAPGERRGLFSALGRRLLKVLVFPVTDFVLGQIGKGIARAWESGKAPYGLRTFEADNYQQPGAGGLVASDWPRLAAGPALLFVHGTFSTAHGCFSRMPREALAELGERYGGRTFALNHWTLSHDPRENVEWLIQQLPPGPVLDLDIVCHSRGGLVSRALAHGLASMPGGAGRVRVGRIVFVATPNEGTPLAAADHMVNMLDRYTNIVQFLPDGPVELVLEAIVTAVKTLAHAGLKHLPGLAAQSPGSDFLDWLRAQPVGDTRYFGIAADWEPAAGVPLAETIKQRLADGVMDGVFGNEKNDLVVPTLGVGETATGPGFPIPAGQLYTYAADAGAIHTNLFGHQKTSERLLEWLTPRAAGPVP